MSSPRILLISPSMGEKEVWRSSQTEFLDVILGVDSVDVVTPTTKSQELGRFSGAIQSRLRRAAGVRLTFDTPLKPIQIERDYDLCFFYVQSVSELAILKALPNWRSRCRNAVCWVEELWLPEISRNPHIAALRQFDRVVVPFYNSVEALRKITGVPCDWLPHGVDALRFHPGTSPPPRCIDVLSIGRRSELTHEAIRDYAKQRNWFYHFDTSHSAKVPEMLEHRQQVAELIKRSKYFLVNRAKAGESSQTVGQQEIASRFFEGIAAGAALVGDVPQSPHFERCFDWPDAVFRLPYASTEVEKVFNELEAEPDRVSEARRQNVVQSLRRFDWAYRWQDVLRSVGLAPANALTARLTMLANIAASYGASGSALTGITGITGITEKLL